MGDYRDGRGSVGKEIDKKLMDEAGILETAFQEFATGCEFSKEERETLEKLDDVLKNADIVLSKDGSSATIAVPGLTYKVGAYPTKKLEPDNEENQKVNKGGYRDDYRTSANPSRNSNMVGEDGNEDAKILGKAVQLLGKDREGLSKADIELIEKLDAVLKNADIVIGENGKDISIIQSNGVVHSTNSSGRNR